MKWSTERPRQKNVCPVQEEDMESLLRYCGSSRTGIRNRAILAVLFFSGVRGQEALELRLSDVIIEGDGAFLNVRHSKNGLSRNVKLYDPGVRFLRDWIEERRGVNGISDCDGILFCTHASGEHMTPGRALDTGYLRAMIYRLKRRSGYSNRLHPHAFRYGHMQHLQDLGVDIFEIADQVGHESVEATVYYLKEIRRAQAASNSSMYDVRGVGA